MSNLLNNKVVIVTGDASGIGRAIAISAAQHGARAVIVSDITEEPREGGTRTTAEIAELGVIAWAAPAIKANWSPRRPTSCSVKPGRTPRASPKGWRAGAGYAGYAD